MQVLLQKLILAVLGTQGRRREFGFSFEEIASCDEVTRGGNAGRKVFWRATSSDFRLGARGRRRSLPSPRSVISRSQDKLMHQRLKGVTLCRRWRRRTEVQLDALIKTQTVRRQSQRLSGVGELHAAHRPPARWHRLPFDCENGAPPETSSGFLMQPRITF